MWDCYDALFSVLLLSCLFVRVCWTAWYVDQDCQRLPTFSLVFSFTDLTVSIVMGVWSKNPPLPHLDKISSFSRVSFNTLPRKKDNYWQLYFCHVFIFYSVLKYLCTNFSYYSNMYMYMCTCIHMVIPWLFYLIKNKLPKINQPHVLNVCLLYFICNIL